MAKGLRSKSKRAFRTIKRWVAAVGARGLQSACCCKLPAACKLSSCRCRPAPPCCGKRLPRLRAQQPSPLSHPRTACLAASPPWRSKEVVKAPTKVEEEAKRQEAMAAVLAAPRPPPADGGAAADAPAAMEQDAGGAGAMAVDGQALGAGLTTGNPSKLLKKLRKQVGAGWVCGSALLASARRRQRSGRAQAGLWGCRFAGRPRCPLARRTRVTPPPPERSGWRPPRALSRGSRSGPTR